MGAERVAAAGVRHPSRRLRDHAPDDRQRAVPLHDVHAGGGAGRRIGARALGVRPARLRDGRRGRQPRRLQAPRRRRARRGRRHACLHQQPRQPVRARRQDRRAHPGIRRGGAGLTDPGLYECGERRRVRPDVAARRFRGPGDRRQPRAGPHPAPLRHPRVRAGVRRAYGRAALDVLHGAAVERRIRRGHLGRRDVALHRPCQCLGSDVAGRGARPAVRADEHAERRLLGRAPARRQPVRRDAAVPRCADGAAAVAFPGCPSRAVGLRLHVAARIW